MGRKEAAEPTGHYETGRHGGRRQAGRNMRDGDELWRGTGIKSCGCRCRDADARMLMPFSLRSWSKGSFCHSSSSSSSSCSDGVWGVALWAVVSTTLLSVMSLAPTSTVNINTAQRHKRHIQLQKDACR